MGALLRPRIVYVMAARLDRLYALLVKLDQRLSLLGGRVGPSTAVAIERWRSDAAAAQFHLAAPGSAVGLLVAVLGGTGTGKSTIVNRLTGANITATSFRRTFTTGPVAIARWPDAVPEGWLGLPRTAAGNGDLPARGRPGELIVVPFEHRLTERLTLVDTPDLDGDQPAHLFEADRVFRWAQAALFVVTPEKYQMTELLPYYRLARRYGLPALFVMNKCEESAVLDDFRALLAEREWADAPVFTVPRDDAAYEPLPQAGLAGLEQALLLLQRSAPQIFEAGIARRSADLIERLRDRIIAPLKEDRQRVHRLLDTLNVLRSPAGNVDVSPLTLQLQRRMQEQSVLYLMGPGRVMERVRQLPGILARLPRTAWSFVVRGETGPLVRGGSPDPSSAPPDFARILADQFAIVQSRIEDALRSDPATAAWLEARSEAFGATRIDPAEAARIAEEELADMKAWLEQRWNSAPRDTQIIQRLMSYLPGGRMVTRWSEAAPYLLAFAVAAHGAIFGPVDLMIIGGWTVATWLGEKLSNEVTARTRRTNHRISERFERLARQQVDKVAAWLSEQAVEPEALDSLEKLADGISEVAEHA